jgi:hypothetical protein
MATANRQATFLNGCTLQELTNLFGLVTPRCHNWNRSEANRAQIEGLRGVYMMNPLGAIVLVTHSGEWWMDWSECCIFYPGIVPNPIVPPVASSQIQFAACPAGISQANFNAWKGRSANVKPLAHVIAWKQANIATQVPQNLGAGTSISHLCDTASCCRRDHLVLAAAHQANMDRQRCRGVMLIAITDATGLSLIIRQERCSHDTSNDFSESCRRVHIISLDGLPLLVNPNVIQGLTIRVPGRQAALP